MIHILLQLQYTYSTKSYILGMPREIASYITKQKNLRGNAGDGSETKTPKVLKMEKPRDLRKCVKTSPTTAKVPKRFLLGITTYKYGCSHVWFYNMFITV